MVRLTGATSTSWDFYTGRGHLNGNAHKVRAGIAMMMKNRTLGEAVVENFWESFEQVGLDPEAPGAMPLHYTLFRSRAHYGRAWYNNLAGSKIHAPLCTTRIAALDMFAAAQGWDPRTVYRDIFMLTDPTLMAMPFMGGKGFPQDLIEASPFKGQSKLTPRKMKVWGEWDASQEEDVVGIKKSEQHSPDNLIEGVRALLHQRIGQIDRGMYAQYFTASDFEKVDAELAAQGSLSHGYFKSIHLMSLDRIYRTIS
jgi:hypothetical protein